MSTRPEPIGTYGDRQPPPRANVVPARGRGNGRGPAPRPRPRPRPPGPPTRPGATPGGVAAAPRPRPPPRPPAGAVGAPADAVGPGYGPPSPRNPRFCSQVR